MLFEERHLKEYAEPVFSSELKTGEVYFFVNFIGEGLLFPTMEPMVFVGRDLANGDDGQVYFQDLESHRQGIRFDDENADTPAKFYCGDKNELGHVFEYERALDVLMACSLRRRKAKI